MDYISWSNLTNSNRIIEIYDEDGLADTYITLRTFSPNKGKNMNNATTNNTVEQTDNVGQNFYIDAEGNRVEIPFEVPFKDNDGHTFDGSNGETTQPETAFIAEDAADHPVTVH